MSYLTINLIGHHHSTAINTYSVWAFSDHYKLQHTGFIEQPCKNQNEANYKAFECVLDDIIKLVKENPKKINAIVIKSEADYVIGLINSNACDSILKRIKTLALLVQAGSIDARCVGNQWPDKPSYVHRWIREKCLQFVKYKL